MFRPLLNPHARWVPEIGYVLRSRPDRKEALDHDHSVWGNCSESIPEVPEAHRRKPMLCFIGFSRGQFSHVARAEVRYKARSGNDKLDMWQVEELLRPISIARLKKALNGKGANAAQRVLDVGGHLPPKALESVMEALKRVDPETFERANSLIKRHGPSSAPLPEIARENIALQRDAVVTALDIAKIPREVLSQPDLKDRPGTGVTSIFDDLTEVRGLEDILVMHDLGGAADWAPLREHRYPAKTFTNSETVLTVVLANKLPLERQLGVDLIYVNETLRCVVFVQYKVMRGKDGEDGYRPDGQLKEEIVRMDKVAAMLAGLPVDQASDGYRLGGEAFFLKFCKDILDERDSGMVPGYYLPLGFWKRLEADPRIRGERGGVKVILCAKHR